MRDCKVGEEVVAGCSDAAVGGLVALFLRLGGGGGVVEGVEAGESEEDEEGGAPVGEVRGVGGNFWGG